MANVKVKAKRTFAAGKTIFYPYASKPYEVNEEQAAIWAKTGYVEIVGEAQNEPEPAEKEQDNTNTPEAPENAEEGQNEVNAIDYDGMSYNQLKDAAKAAGIKGYNTMKKKALLKELKGE